MRNCLGGLESQDSHLEKQEMGLQMRRRGPSATFCPSCIATLAPQVTDSIFRSLPRVENQRPWSAVPGGVAERVGLGWWAGSVVE